MARAKPDMVFDLPAALVAAWNTNGRINQYLVQSLPEPVWRMPQPGGKGRTVAGMVAHMHNVRILWLKAAGSAAIPDKLEGDDFAPARARESLASSSRAVGELVAASLAQGGRVKGFKPDVAGFLGYQIAHDAHHRGQITMLCRQLGHPVPQKVMYGMWEWGSR